jgi:acetyl-CoA decarbonylase/synthase complex subunit alpha
VSRKAHVKIEELKTDAIAIKNLEVSIGKIIEETWTESIGPTPFPSITSLRDWDLKLLQRTIMERKE